MTWWEVSRERTDLPEQHPPAETERGLWGAVSEELDRIRSEEEEAPLRAKQAEAWLEEQIRIQDIEKLKSMLKARLNVDIEPDSNPVSIDGLTFGVKRNYKDSFDDVDGYITKIIWTLYLLRPCDHCGNLRPALTLGRVHSSDRKKRLTVGRLFGTIKMAVTRPEVEQEEDGIRELALYLHELRKGVLKQPWADDCSHCGDKLPW